MKDRTDMPDLLIELFSEEIPARMQARAREDLRRLVTDGLVEAGLTYASAGAFSTPRRLTLAVEGLSPRSARRREERKGPRVDAPEKAVEGFVRATGVPLERLERRAAGKAEVFFAVIETPGREAAEIVAEVLEAAIRAFPWPKSMRWGEGSLRWVRPLHSILCILSDEAGAATVPLTVDGIAAGAETEGHRFMSPGRFSVTNFDDYRAKLRRAHVMLDHAEREAAIKGEAETLAFARGLEVVADPGLLAEVAGLVEWPVVLMGEIGADFLDLPPEVLQTSMKEHQKFFSIRNPRTGRIEGFVTVANRETADHGATILAGNRKVLSARLSDAKFFWENDLRTVLDAGLEGMGAGLAQVTFHNKLGSQADRVARIAALAREIAPLVGADPDLAEQAARVVKADLRSEMVGEFPELQGLMGSYYASKQGFPEKVVVACKAHYQPLGPSDDVPTEPISVAVALADKIDTLAGFWVIGEKPTGSKDPFALRRAALGVIRLLLESSNATKLSELFEKAAITVYWDRYDRHGTYGYRVYDGPKGPFWISGYKQTEASTNSGHLGYDEYEPSLPRELFEDFLRAGNICREKDLGRPYSEIKPVATPVEISADLLTFLHDRLKVHLRDAGIRHDVIDACLAMPGSDDLTLLVRRAEALAAFLKTEDGTNLIQGFKRANNILTQAEEKDGVEYSYGANPSFAEGPEETALFAALDRAEAAIGPAMAAEDFGAAMAAMAAMRVPIDAFFEAVQVNADSQVLRRNRLNLLSRIRSICLDVADLTRIEG